MPGRIHYFNPDYFIILTHVKHDIIAYPLVYHFVHLGFQPYVKQICCAVIVNSHILKFSIKYIHGNGYNRIFLNHIEYFQFFLFIKLTIPDLPESKNFTLSQST
jgi:hypothetical protein